jgi:peroxiredoxin
VHGLRLEAQVLPAIPFRRVVRGSQEGLGVVIKAGDFGKPEARAKSIEFVKSLGGMFPICRKETTVKTFMLSILSVLMFTCNALALQPGDLAPSFSLKDHQGKSFTLADHVGKDGKGDTKGLILGFFAPQCKPCRHELSVLNSLTDGFKAQGIQVAIVGYYEDFNQIMKYLAEIHVDKPIILSDKDGKVSVAYGVHFLPATFFISFDGKVKEIMRGESSHIERALQQNAAELLK